MDAASWNVDRKKHLFQLDILFNSGVSENIFTSQALEHSWFKLMLAPFWHHPLCCPFLSADSILTETLRLTAAVMIRREVVQEKVVRMASGQQYRLRRGDIVVLFPLLSPQMDPEIHQKPQVPKAHGRQIPIKGLTT